MRQDSKYDAIIEKAKAGDTHAFQIIVETNQSFVFAVAFRFVNSKSDAQDIAQEVFVRLWRNLGKYRKEVKLTTWLYTIITNLCLDFLKSRQTRNNKYAASLESSYELADPAETDQGLLNEELRKIIHQTANTLTPRQKAVFVLRDLEGLDVSEVAEVLKISAGTIKSNLYYARIKIAEGINHFYQQHKCNRP